MSPSIVLLFWLLGSSMWAICPSGGYREVVFLFQHQGTQNIRSAFSHISMLIARLGSEVEFCSVVLPSGTHSLRSWVAPHRGTRCTDFVSDKTSRAYNVPFA